MFPRRGMQFGDDDPPPRPTENGCGAMHHAQPGQPFTVPPVALQKRQAALLYPRVRAAGFLAPEQVEIVLEKLTAYGFQIAQRFGGRGHETVIDFGLRPAGMAGIRSRLKPSLGVGLPLAYLRFR